MGIPPGPGYEDCTITAQTKYITGDVIAL
jgi:hypothetical protein